MTRKIRVPKNQTIVGVSSTSHILYYLDSNDIKAIESIFDIKNPLHYYVQYRKINGLGNFSSLVFINMSFNKFIKKVKQV